MLIIFPKSIRCTLERTDLVIIEALVLKDVVVFIRFTHLRELMLIRSALCRCLRYITVLSGEKNRSIMVTIVDNWAVSCELNWINMQGRKWSR